MRLLAVSLRNYNHIRRLFPLIRVFIGDRFPVSLYTPCLEKQAKLFCHNLVKSPPSPIHFGTNMASSLKLYEVHLFSTSPNSCQCTAAHLCAKNYQSWWKFDIVITKTILLGFVGETVYIVNRRFLMCFI